MADGRASSTRAIADLLCLDKAGGGADSRFISAIRRAGVDEWWQLVGRYLEALGVFQNRRGRLDCLPVRAT